MNGLVFRRLLYEYHFKLYLFIFVSFLECSIQSAANIIYKYVFCSSIKTSKDMNMSSQRHVYHVYHFQGPRACGKLFLGLPKLFECILSLILLWNFHRRIREMGWILYVQGNAFVSLRVLLISMGSLDRPSKDSQKECSVLVLNFFFCSN